MRAVMGRPSFAHTRELYQHLSFLNISETRTCMVAVYVRKALDSNANNEFRTRDGTSYSLRNVDPSSLAVPFMNTSHS